MKKLVPLCVMFLTSAVFAGQPDGPQSAAQELELVRNARMVRTASQVHPTATIKTSFEQWIFIPAAGSLQGNFGTFYKSDVMLANYRNVPQIVRVRWIPQAGDGFSTTVQRITIPAMTALAYTDFVGQTLRYTGLGAIEIVARTAADSIDLNAQIDAYSRIWTPQPNTTLGTVSQNFAGVGIFHTEGQGQAFALGMQQDTKFRVNVGIVNIDFFNARTWTVQVAGVNGSTSFTITVPAFSMVQQSIPAGNFGALYIVFTPPAGFTDDWSAYASTSDNGTGDGWVSQATQIKP